MADTRAEREATLVRLMNTYADVLTGLCVGILGDRTLAQDAVQETFLKAWRGLGRFRGERADSEKAWLYRIAINQCRSMRRSRWLRHVPLEEAASLAAPAPEEKGLLSSLKSLRPRSREVLLLRYLEEMSVSDMAEALGITPSSVYRRLEAARAELEETLERQEKEDEG